MTLEQTLGQTGDSRDYDGPFAQGQYPTWHVLDSEDSLTPDAEDL